MAVEIKTGRGPYRVIEAAPAATDGGSTVLTLALERADGIERVVFRCRLNAAPASSVGSDALIAKLQADLEREFETIREAALKSIRSEHKLHEITFDRSARDKEPS